MNKARETIKNFCIFWQNFHQKNPGQGTIEYLVIIGVVVVIALTTISFLGGFLNITSSTGTTLDQIQQINQPVYLNDIILNPNGELILDIKTNETRGITINQITANTDFEFYFKNNTIPLGTHKIFLVHTNNNCKEDKIKNIQINYTTTHGLNQTQEYQNLKIPCQNINTNQENLTKPQPLINFISPTPNQNSTTNQNNIDINIHSQSPRKTTTFIDFNN